MSPSVMPMIKQNGDFDYTQLISTNCCVVLHKIFQFREQISRKLKNFRQYNEKVEILQKSQNFHKILQKSQNFH